MIGQTISHYRIIEKLGEGGMGAVYKARDLSLNRLVALKFLPSHLTKNQSVRKRFTGEAQAASALDHPNLCTIHEINETEDGQLYICMAFYEGETLKEKIKDKKLEVNDALHYALQIAYGLQRAHEEGIIHRDIKPANIIVTDKGEAKIVDFGLAKLAGEKLTESVSTKGTIAYMAPEFIRGLPADHRADLWSLGIVLFEMLTGHLPFQSEFPEPMMYAIVNEKPQLLSRYMDHAPEALQAIIDKLLEKNPGMRYRNLDEFLSDLRKFKPELTESHNQVIRKKIKRVPQKKMTAIGFSLILLSGIFLLYNNIIKFTSVESKPIAVISFENQTGEDEYDYLQKAIPNLLISSLEQSGDLRVATWERLNDLLKQKGMQDVKIINPEMGFEICRMDGIETIVLGSYTRAGEVFALDIKVLDVKSKELLQSASSRGQGISSILTSQIDELSRSILREMGVSAKTSLPTQPIAEVTTSSMEAYNYFIRGREEYEKRNIENSRQFLEKAVKLDTTFATAYSYLAVSYYMLDNRKAGNMSLQKAKLYINKATEKERLYIEARYAQHLERNNEKRFDLWHKITEKYPQEKRAQLDLAHFYYARRKLYAQAIERYQKVIELDPKFGLTYNMMALTYMEMGEYRQALKSFERYAAVNPGDANVFDSTGECILEWGNWTRHWQNIRKPSRLNRSIFMLTGQLLIYMH